MEKGRDCDNCRFCCWSFGVHDIPNEIKGFEDKFALKHCPYECKMGCSIHNKNNYPPMCKSFICPYLAGESIYRPDTFQSILEELKGDVGNYIPNIPSNFPIEKTKELIRKTRSFPASILVGNEWVKVILALDRKEDKTWEVSKETIEEWQNFCKNYE